MKVKKKKPAKSRIRKVYHIVRFVERFEMPDNVRFERQKPLQYVKYYVGSGVDEIAIAFKQQIGALKFKENWRVKRDIFYDLLEFAANRSRCFRGYLLGADYQPATVEQITQWLGIKPSECEQILKELIEVGLLEKVVLPKFNPPVTKKKSKKSGGGKSKTSSANEPSRARTCANEPSRARPYNKKKTANGNGNSKRKKKKKTAPLQKKKRNLNKNSKGVTRKKPLPLKPKVSDLGVGSQKSGSPPQSINSLGSILQQSKHRYDPEARQFGSEIYRALQVPHLPTSAEGRRELGCFASAWMKAQTELSPAALVELRAKSVTEAQQIGRKRRLTKFTKSPEAVWRYVFNERVKQYK